MQSLLLLFIGILILIICISVLGGSYRENFEIGQSSDQKQTDENFIFDVKQKIESRLQPVSQYIDDARSRLQNVRQESIEPFDNTQSYIAI